MPLGKYPRDYMSESKRSKTERLFVGVIIAVVVITAVVPAVAYLSHQTETGTGGKILTATEALSVETVTEKNNTSQLTDTAFSSTAQKITYTHTGNITLIQWNATFKELNEASAYKIVFNETGGNKGSIGYMQNQTYMPFTSGVFSNGTLNLSIAPQYTLTPNSNNDLYIQLNQTTPVNLTVTIFGQNTILSSTIGTIPSLDMAYISTGLITLGLAFMVSPHHNGQAINPMEHTKKRQRRYRRSTRYSRQSYTRQRRYKGGKKR